MISQKSIGCDPFCVAIANTGFAANNMCVCSARQAHHCIYHLPNSSPKRYLILFSYRLLLPLPSSARPHFFLDAPPIGQVYQNPVVAGSSLISKNASSLSAPLISNARLKVRTGYFGLCISTDNSGWICNRDIATLKKSIIATRLI